MTKNEEIQKRRKKILELLREADQEHPVPLAELMETFHASRRTIYGDLDALRENGWIVETIHKKGIYIGGRSEKTEYAYEKDGLLRKSNVDSILDVLLMITIQLSENPMTMDEIINAYDRTCSYESNDPAGLKNAVNRRVDQLVGTGHLVKNGEEYSISPSAPVYLELTEEQIVRLNDLILLYGQGISHAKTLAGIAEKLRAVYEGGMLRENRDASGIGLRRIRSDEVHNQVERIHKYAYDRKKLSITYEGRTGTKSEIGGFSTGLVIYASDKDRLYLIGKCETQTEVAPHQLSNPYYVLDVGRILEIQEENKDNGDFQSEEYMKMYQQMLVVDVDPPEKVSVEVSAGNRNLIRKMERHVRNRNTDCPEGKGCATFTKDGDHYLYSDTVRGNSELARFLRQFGSGVTVRGPESLREKMKNTAERALERYGVK